MGTVWKFDLPEMTNHVQIPKGARVLSVQMQRGELRLWAAVDPGNPNEQRTFVIFPTGGDGPTPRDAYIATVQTHGESLVWHVFEAT